MNVLGWMIAAWSTVFVVPVMVRMLFPRRLPAVPQDVSDWPAVAVIVPAKDEGGTVRDAFRSVLALEYAALRIVAIDDRSTDDTGTILDELAAEDSRVTVIHIDTLPEGWLGKNYANHVGAQSCDSSWLLFTDSDIHFQPDTIERAIEHARRGGFDHVTLFPRLLSGGLGEELLSCTFGLLFFIRFTLWLVRSRVKMFYTGIGAFNLIRRDAYDTIGGHERLALEVLDDVKLGKLVKAHGLRQDAVDGSLQISVRWQQGVWGVVRGLTKNAFAGESYSLARMMASSLLFMLVFLLPYGGVALTRDPASAGFLYVVGVLELTFALLVWRAGCNLLVVPFLPASLLLLLYAMWRSTILTLRRGGVEWRGTFYPLAELRKGVV